MSNQFLKKTPTELRFIERSVLTKEVKNQNLWNIELGSQESMNVLKWIIKGFQQRDRRESQKLNKDAFCRLPVIRAQYIIGTKILPDGGILSNYDDDEYTEGLHQIKEAFTALTKDNTLQSYVSDDDFRSSNIRADDDNLYVFDKRYQKSFTACQPLKVEYKLDGVGPMM